MSLRPTVAALLLRPAEPYPLIAAHWPTKACDKGEYTLTTVGGGINPGEVPIEAMCREIREEYGLSGVRLYPVRVPVMEAHGKLYHWFIGVVDKQSFAPDQAEVAAVHWYAGPDAFGSALTDMSDDKRRMVREVIQVSVRTHPRLLLHYVAV